MPTGIYKRTPEMYVSRRGKSFRKITAQRCPHYIIGWWKCKECRRQYQKNHRLIPEIRERQIKYDKEYRAKNRKHRYENQKKNITANPKLAWSRSKIYCHIRSGYQVEFTTSQLADFVKDIEICSFCNVKLDWGFRYDGTGRNRLRPSVDRIDNEKILRLNNIQIICWRCNATKYDRTMKEFVDYCKMMANKYDSKEQSKPQLEPIVN